eukprot:TRINITY_DN8879_c0_g1_i6.p1 TRINITY_DN8879_c0_g1~~TRINITY_DN8879_c0_g1_i6.p1  ORF type:complete len:176 (+),score=29.31 TRINITY_DN8879_c0_g1_i6:32-529(+)
MGQPGVMVVPSTMIDAAFPVLTGGPLAEEHQQFRYRTLGVYVLSVWNQAVSSLFVLIFVPTLRYGINRHHFPFSTQVLDEAYVVRTMMCLSIQLVLAIAQLVVGRFLIRRWLQLDAFHVADYIFKLDPFYWMCMYLNVIAFVCAIIMYETRLLSFFLSTAYPAIT